ncbi:hypothetical protein D0T87_14380 [Bacteroides sp. 51]|nr:hypothetical protein [Bacteroides sp. 51]
MPHGNLGAAPRCPHGCLPLEGVPGLPGEGGLAEIYEGQRRMVIGSDDALITLTNNYLNKP